jgi:hypothetical protein
MRLAATKALLLASTTLIWFAISSAPAAAAVPLTQLSSDPFTNTTSQHRTEVEPDSFSFGSTIVTAFQVGRFFDGGASDIGFATSSNAGATWQNGFLPGITRFFGAGPYDRASDPAVAFDARHGVWMISSLALRGASNPSGAGVLTSRSTDGGRTWGPPVFVTGSAGADKNWIVCDNNSLSPFFGRCYTEWDQPGNGGLIRMSTSANGGLSWGVARASADSTRGLGGQPVVQLNGTVIVPYASSSFGSIRSFRSVDGGANWRVSVQVAGVVDHPVAGGLRSGPLPSAEIDAAGKVYVVWQDCRFRTSCRSNDLVLSTTTQGSYPTWSSVARIPIDSTATAVDHFIPGLAVDRASSGATARLGLAYYYYPNAACSFSTCQLNVGYVFSHNGASTWSAPTQLTGPMSLSWLASTSQGRMVGDYISSSFASGGVRPVFAGASAPFGGLFNEPIFTTASALP